MGASPKGAGWATKFDEFLTGSVNDEGEQRGFCPIHEEPGASKTPSGSFNFTNGMFMCFSGCGGMSLSTLWKMVLEDRGEDQPSRAPRSNVRSLDDAPSKRKTGESKLPDDDQINTWVARLQENSELLKKLSSKRGLTPQTLEEFEVGWDGTRFTLPVRDADGVLRNVRRYMMDAAKSEDKMRNITGHGEGRLYLSHILANEDEVIITEGEMDSLVGQQHGLPTMTHTSGAKVWKPVWNEAFRDKTVFLCYDVDDAGKQGAKKAARELSKVTDKVYIITLPIDNIKGGDLTDYLVGLGYTAEDFRVLMENARKRPVGGLRPGRSRREAEATRVTLEQSMDTGIQGVKEIVATVAGKVQPAYIMPREIEFHCNYDWSTTKCNACPMNNHGHMKKSVEPDDPIILELIDKPADFRQKTLLKMADIVHTCPKVEVEEARQWAVEELVLIPAVDEAEEHESRNPINRRAINVDAFNTPINTKVRVVGLNSTDPKTGRGLLHTWVCEQQQTDIDRFKMTPELLETLRPFQPSPQQTPMEKLEEIALDMEANVTKIYGRTPLHIAYDLVWHSVLDFKFKGVRLGKGWLEMMVVGDTRTGKSEAANKLIDHYGAGILKSCEGATFAGLVGGAQQMGNNWMVTWGTIPLQDRRLVVLDEFSGMSDRNIIEQMSSVRSSGIAQITKIVSQETSARTRLIWISNPEDGRAIEEMSRGAIEAMRTLVKNPEDIARFDLAMSAARADVDSKVINSERPPKRPHVFTSEMSKMLVAWAWSRKFDDVKFGKGVEKYILQRAEEIGHQYVPEPPLIQAENVRVKLARVAVAVAARLFSTEDGEKVLVGKEHVDAAESVMNMLYGMASFGYKDYSRKVLRDRAQAAENKKKCKKYLRLHQHDSYVALQAVMGGDFKVRDFSEFAGMSQDEAQTAVRELQEMKMVRRMSKGYIRMDPALVVLLRELEDEWEGH